MNCVGSLVSCTLDICNAASGMVNNNEMNNEYFHSYSSARRVRSIRAALSTNDTLLLSLLEEDASCEELATCTFSTSQVYPPLVTTEAHCSANC